jgi:hypothetical protein
MPDLENVGQPVALDDTSFVHILYGNTTLGRTNGSLKMHFLKFIPGIPRLLCWGSEWASLEIQGQLR